MTDCVSVAGPGLRLLLPLMLLLLARQSSGQLSLLFEELSSSLENTSLSSENGTFVSNSSSDPALNASRQNWSRAEDGVLEIADFIGPDLPAPPLQQVSSCPKQCIQHCLWPVGISPLSGEKSPTSRCVFDEQNCSPRRAPT